MSDTSGAVATVAAQLRAEATAHQAIALDATIVASDIATAIATSFAVATGALTIAVDASDISDPTGDQLTIAGTGAVLGVDQVAITVTFAVGAGAADLVVTVVAAMPGGWTFATSFPGLAGSVFDALTVTGASFVYSTVAQPGAPWPAPDPPTATVDLVAGLTFASCVVFTGTLALAGLVTAPAGAVALAGAFGPQAGQSLPVGQIAATLTTDSFGVGVGADALTLTNPRIAVQVAAADDTDPAPVPALVLLADLNEALEFQITCAPGGTGYLVSAAPLPAASSVAGLIEQLPGGAGFASYLPSEVADLFAEVSLDEFVLSVDTSTVPTVGYVGLAIGTTQPWPLLPDVGALEQLQLRIDVVDPGGMGIVDATLGAAALFLPSVFADPFTFTVGLVDNGGWAIDTVSGAYVGSVTVAELAAGLGGPSDLPAALGEIALTGVALSATRSGPQEPFTVSGTATVDAALDVLDTAVTAQVCLAFTQGSGAYAVDVVGVIVVGDEMFGFTFDVGASTAQLKATWSSQGAPLDFATIATTFGWSAVPTLPAALDVGVTSAGFSYDFDAGALVLDATTSTGHVDFASMLVGGARAYLLDVVVGVDVSLAELPVVGPQLPADLVAGVNSVEVIYASADLDAATISGINTTLVALGGAAVGFDSATAGLLLSAAVSLGSDSGTVAVPIALPAVAPADAPADPADSTALVAATGPAASPAVAPSTSRAGTWWTVNKTLGPLQVQAVGLDYVGGQVWLLLDASFAAAGLDVALVGLGVGFTLTDPPQFSPALHGLTVSLAAGPVRIAGGLLEVDLSDLTVEYDGAISIAAEILSLAALGSWATVDGHPSLFVFAVLNEPPLGGPPIFFVTGVAAGFGYNRALAIPPLADLATFPFVAAAVGTGNPFTGGADPNAALEVLVGPPQYVPEAIGEYWLAAGVRFTSFDLLQSFALVTVQFGARFELAVLGLSSVTVPTLDPYPIAYAELAIEVVFAPDDGVLLVAAQLTSTSFVLAAACHLTGGFALAWWFRDEQSTGALAGVVVVTLGGYYPGYEVPKYYPTAPLLGVNWQVDANLAIKGGLYFALVPSAVMAGGSLQATWTSGDLKAWYTADADFLLSWKPFHYQAEVSISVGASYHLRIGFISHTFNVHVGASISMWGPPFGGVAHVDLDVISITIRFGSDRPTVAAIPWREFTSSFLPAPPSSADASGTTPQYCQIKAVAGLVSDLTQTAGATVDWVLDPERMGLQTVSSVPLTAATWQSATSPATTLLAEPPTPFGVGPVGIADGGLSSIHAITVSDVADPEFVVDTSACTITPVTTNAPGALWNKSLGIDLVTSPSISTVNSTASTIAVVTGFSIAAALVAPDTTPTPIDLTMLSESPAATQPTFAWSATAVPTTDDFDQSQAMSQLSTTIDSTAAPARAAILDALAAAGVAINTQVSLADLASDAPAVLLAPPVLAVLGETPPTTSGGPS